MPTVYNKVTAGGQTLIDLSQDTVTDASHIVSGHTGHLADGTQVAGTGGGSVEVEEKQVNFIDYDGKILYSYTAQEANALTDLPANPSHTGLTAQGWNWTLAQIKTQLTNLPDGPVWVGQSYVTTSGKTEIDIELVSADALSPYLNLAVNGTVSIDWGDGTSATSATGTSVTTRTGKQHTYSQPGKYTISIDTTSATKMAFYSTTSYTLLYRSSTDTQNDSYANTIRHIRIGNKTDIGAYAFYKCHSMETITVPTSVTSVGNYAFNDCYSVKAAVFPSTLTTLGNYAMRYCLALARISIAPACTTANTYALANLYALTSFTVPPGITTTSEGWMLSSNSLATLYLPEGLTTIGVKTFQNGLSLASVTIPSSVTKINTQAFDTCRSIFTFHLKRTSPPTLSGTNAFANLPASVIFYVPRSENQTVLNAYKNASNWSTYASKMQEEPA